MLGSKWGAAKSCGPGQGSSVSAQLGEGDGGVRRQRRNNWQHSEDKHLPWKEGDLTGLLWFLFFPNEKENLRQYFFSFPSSNSYKCK